MLLKDKHLLSTAQTLRKISTSIIMTRTDEESASPAEKCPFPLSEDNRVMHRGPFRWQP